MSAAASRLRRRRPARGRGGLASRRLRAALSALGIAIGIAAMVAVLGISESSRAEPAGELDKLGTNLLRSRPARSSFSGDDASCRHRAIGDGRAGSAGRGGRVGRRSLGSATRAAHRPDLDRTRPGGIGVLAADPELLQTLGGDAGARALPRRGRPPRYPTVVLGAIAAERLGIDRTGVAGVRSAASWFTVIGILDPLPLAPELDRAALIGYPVAEAPASTPTNPSTIYVRADPDRVEDVRVGARPRPPTRHPERGRRQPAVRRARGPGGGQDGLHLAVPRARRGGAAGRRRSGSPT